jgi:hypothetical protein
MTLLYFPGTTLTLTGFRASIKAVTACNGEYALSFRQEGEKITVELPEELSSYTAPVLKFICDRPPVIYRTGGLRTPECPHPRYDPVPPDILY